VRVILVDFAMSSICPVSGQSRKCRFGAEGIGIGVIQAPKLEPRIMRYKLTDYEWAKRPFLANKPRGVLCVNDLLAHDLFRSSFARRSGLREGGKPISTLGSSPRAGFSGSCAVLLKTMRLKSGIWVAAYVRRCHIEAAFAAVRRRGAD